MKRVLASFGILSLILVLSACSEDLVEEVTPFNVTYVDEDGTLIASYEVMPGEDAPVPEDPFKEGFTFEGWSEVAQNVNRDIEINAIYERLVFTITYLDFDGRVIVSYPVYYGEDAPLPEEPFREGYTFEGWSQLAANIQENLEIKASYERLVFNVTYLDFDGRIIANYEVNYGEKAPIPNEPSREGYTFEGWSEEGTHVKKDVEVRALYSINLIPITEYSDLMAAEFCKIGNAIPSQEIMAGFPISSNRISNIGQVNVRVIFVDFPDYVGTLNESQIDEFFNEYIGGIVRFFDNQSFGKVSFEFTRHPGFLRIPKPTSELSLDRSSGARDLDFIIREAIKLTDKDIDYSNTDMVIVFLNPDVPEKIADVSPAWPMNFDGRFQTMDGPIYNGTVIAGDAVRIGYPIIAHEIGHLFGLIDLYVYDWLKDNPNRDYRLQFKHLGVFDFMNLAPPSQLGGGDNREMLAWQRFLLDWITIDQVRCVDSKNPSITTHHLIPTHIDDDGFKLIVIPFNQNKTLVIEIKEANQYCVICSGGVYSYIVDTNFGNGQGPIRMLRPEHSIELLFTDAYLSLGQSLIYENIEIKFISSYPHIVIEVIVK